MKTTKKHKRKINLISQNLRYSRAYRGEKNQKPLDSIFKYINGFKNNFCIYNLIELKLFFKKSLKIIFKFDRYKKKILFLNFPDTKELPYSTLVKESNHYFMSFNSTRYLNVFFNRYKTLFDLYGQILNSRTHKEKLNNLKILNQVLRITDNPDLVVIYDTLNIKGDTIKALSRLNIPIIYFFNQSKIKDNSILYKIPGNFNNKIFSKYYYFILKSLLKSKKNIVQFLMKSKKKNS